MNDWLKKVRHQSIKDQHMALCQKIRGHLQYYGLTGNAASLAAFVHLTRSLWRKWLGRRSNKAKRTCEWFLDLLRRFPLPRPIVMHSVLRRTVKP